MPWWRQYAVRGVLWVLLGTFLFSLVFASGKLAGGDIPALQIMFLRYASGFVLLLAVMTVRGPRLDVFATTRPHLHFFRALCGAGGGVCAIYAPMHMPIADATAISLTQGMFIVALAALILRERVSARHWLAALVCAAGALIVVRGQGGGEFALPSVLPAFVALSGALLIAGEMILIKLLAVRERAMTVLLYVNGLAMLLLLGPALIFWRALGAAELFGLLLLGPLAIAGQYCNIRGYRLADAALLGPVGYSWILFAGLIGFVAFGERPGAATLIGGGLIVIGGILLARLHVRSPSASPLSASAEG